MKYLHARLAESHAHLVRGRVWCHRCDRSQAVNSTLCLAEGWPRCCGTTMSIDSPAERAALEARPWVPA
jgi:hypothetical protein